MGAIGNMTRKIELQTCTVAKGTMGGNAATYSHYRYKMASRVPAGEMPENYVNNRLVIGPRFKYTMHADSNVVESMKLIDDGVEYNVLMVTDISDLFIEVLAEKILK